MAALLPHAYRGAPARCRPRLATVLAALLLPAAHAAGAGPAAGDWRFTALLDGTPIGTHRFTLTALAPGERTLVSDARFEVRLLGFTVYRYRHRAEEQWRGDCLASLSAQTDDDGQLRHVSGSATDAGFTVQAKPPAATGPVPGCLMSFAYWHPALAVQRRLLDPGTGRIEAVEVTPLPTTSVDVQGQPVAARGLRITGLAHPIDLWYAGERWIGLDTTVDRGRRLSYRLTAP